MPHTPTYRLVDHDTLGEAIVIKTSYDPEFVDDLKRTIPGRGRRWDPAEKVWCVDRVYEDELFGLVADYFGEEPEWDDSLAPDYDSPKQAKAQPSPKSHPAPEGVVSPETAWATLGLLSTADPDVVKAAYRILSRKFHPDRGGSNEQMARLNMAWEHVGKNVATGQPSQDTTCYLDEDDEVPF